MVPPDTPVVVNPELSPADIRDFLKQAGSTETLADVADVTPTTVRLWLNGDSTPNSIAAARLVQEFGAPSRFTHLDTGTYIYSDTQTTLGWTVFGEGTDVIETVVNLKETVHEGTHC